MTHSALALALMLSACALPPDKQADACRLLDIAQDEAQMATAWHRQAGAVLHACGIPDALWKADMKACYAEARDGYRRAEDCYEILERKP